VDNIFGGCYGYYDYKDPHYKDYTYTTGATDATDANLGLARDGFIKPRLGNAFVNFRPVTSNNTNNRTIVKTVCSGNGKLSNLQASAQNREKATYSGTLTMYGPVTVGTD
jgi:hypothetical protein